MTTSQSSAITKTVGACMAKVSEFTPMSIAVHLRGSAHQFFSKVLGWSIT
jgi:hypothetical protein